MTPLEPEDKGALPAGATYSDGNDPEPRPPGQDIQMFSHLKPGMRVGIAIPTETAMLLHTGVYKITRVRPNGDVVLTRKGNLA